MALNNAILRSIEDQVVDCRAELDKIEAHLEPCDTNEVGGRHDPGAAPHASDSALLGRR